MSHTALQLAELVQGELVGDAHLFLRAARTLQDAGANDITFVENSKQLSRLEQSQAGAALVGLDAVFPARTLIRVKDPLSAFVAIFQHFKGEAVEFPAGIDPRAVIDPSASIGANPSIGPFVTIGAGAIVGDRCRLHHAASIGAQCRVGADVTLYPNVVLYADTVVGDRVTIHANAVIGADGFGYRMHQGRHVKVPQLANVIIGSDVEIGACTCIDRGAFEPTIIGDGTKIDNLVQIAHNCRIGKHNAIAAQVGIAGSCTTGNYVFMGGQSGLSDHVNVADRCQFGAKTGVFQDVPAGKRQWLYPAHDDRLAARIVACLKKLPYMRRDLLRVLKELNLPESGEPATVRNPEAPAA